MIKYHSYWFGVDQDNDLQYGLSVRTAPASEPVTSAEVITQLREDSVLAQTALIDNLITAARQIIEEYLHRSLITTEYTLYRDAFGHDLSEVFIPIGGIQSVDAIRYVDDGGTLQTLSTSNYRVDVRSLIPRVTPAWDYEWPVTRDVSNAVEIDFTAGYGDDAADVPMAIRQAITLLVAHWYENRTPVAIATNTQKIPMTVDALLGSYRVRG